jgi:hypothetical protein
VRFWEAIDKEIYVNKRYLLPAAVTAAERAAAAT